MPRRSRSARSRGCAAISRPEIDGRSTALLALCGAAWGSALLFISEALQAFGPVQISTLRNLIAAGALGAWLAWVGPRLTRAERQALTGRPGLALLTGAVGFAAPLLLVSSAQQHLPTGIVAVVMSSSPLMVAIAAPWFVPQDRFGVRGFVGLLIGIAGVALAAGSESSSGDGRIGPVLLLLCACAMNALYPVLVRRYYVGVRPVAIALHSACGGAAVSLVLLPFVAPPHGISVGPVVAVVVLAVVCTAAPFAVFTGLVAKVGAVRAATANYLIPFTGVLLGVAVLGEDLRLIALAGLALILGGVYLTSTVVRTPILPDPDTPRAVL